MGYRLTFGLASGEPLSWQEVLVAMRLRDAGGEQLRDCLARAEKAGKPEKCRVTMTPPSVQPSAPER